MELKPLLGIIFIVIGAISFINPKLAFEIRTYVGKKFFDMHVKASQKTYKTFRLLGVMYLCIGAALLLG
jgi:hypothetical protein